MTTDSAHAKRVAAELHEAGVGGYGATKFASRYLPNIIHENEKIKAVVYGRYKESGGLLGFAAGMLVATDRRIFFLDHKPGYTSTDELTYELVSGVKKTSSGLFSSVTLHTRLGDYTIRFANSKGLDKFVSYIESRRLETNQTNGATGLQASTVPTGDQIEEAAINFLKGYDTAVLSTVDRAGVVHGATIYYFVSSDNKVNMLTKSATQKARDIFAHQQVALTVFDANKGQTVQLHGLAEVVTDPQLQHNIMEKLIKPRNYDGELRLPPVTTIHEESYVALQILPTYAHFTDYKQQQ